MKKWKDRKKYYLDEDTTVKKKNTKKYFFTKTMKHQTKIMMISVFAVFLVMFGTSYAVFSSVNKTEDFNGVNVGDLHIEYKDESGAISLADSYPLNDEEGLNSKAYIFSIQNTGSLATAYSVKLLDDTAVINGEEKTDSEMSEKILSKKDLKVSVDGNDPVILENLSINNYEILSGKLQPGETKKISVRLWIKSDASNDIFIKNEDGSLTGKYYFGKITVEGENTKTYETDSLLVWLDAINNMSDGHGVPSDSWYDLSGNSNNMAMTNFSGYTWKDNSLNITSSGVSNLFTYDTSSLEQYSVSTSFKLTSNAGNINVLETSDLNIWIDNNTLKIGNLEEGYSIENNKLYTITLIKRKKVTLGLDGVKNTEIVKEVYINGEFYKDVTSASKSTITTSNINIDIYNYLVYSKALTVNRENNNYVLTNERFGG